ncbi:MAG: TonB-dependent receptor, partial [Acidobacteriota bacterium]|nr:TonB-dependent receptor [Acidobacteriota bacterium]
MKIHNKIQLLLQVALVVGVVVAMAPAAGAQDDAGTEAAAGPNDSSPPQSEEGDAPLESFFSETTVTATGTEVDTFEVSTPVSVLDREELEQRMPLNAADLLRTEPGVDVNGVGPNQSRPVIRGQRGMRVLFLENGLRMNNSRRQSDFGETPGLVEIESLEAVEVVRGPASVLYGSDAIGGVLNLITRSPVFGGGLNGSVGARFGSAGDATKVHASASGGSDKISWGGGFTNRSADEYQAASGSFGAIHLADSVTVIDTGLDDDDLYGHVTFKPGDSHEVSLRLNRYRAEETGFGFVEPELLETLDDFRIRILYPFQDFDRYTFGYTGAGLDSVLADTVEFQAYLQNNERQLANDIDVFEAAQFPGAPGTAVASDTLNFTDLETFGFRLETVKGVADKHLLTYGAEYFEDDSINTDQSETTVTLIFPGPPFAIPVAHVVDTVPNAPNATNESYGVFAQGEIASTERLKFTLGARYQNVS